jgi:hypothetical protein
MLARFCKDASAGDLHSEPTIKSLAKICASWDKRAQVRALDLPDPLAFDPDQKDYMDELLSFHQHPAYADADEHDKRAILSCAWLLYNHKTIELETQVLTPACMAIYDLGEPRVLDPTAREVITQTLVDETYHILLTHRVSHIARKHRGLEHLRIPRSTVIARMLALQAEHPERWKKDLILIVTAIVTEVFICGHLKKMSSAEAIQPINVMATKAHLADELVHRSVFRDVAAILYAKLPQEQRQFFLAILPRPTQWFAESEMESWEAILEQLGFDQRRALVGDYWNVHDTSADYSILHAFLREIGGSERDLQPA